MTIYTRFRRTIVHSFTLLNVKGGVIIKKIFLAIVLLFMTGCVEVGDIENGNLPIGYEQFEANGMPCLYVYRTLSKGILDYDGVTCDWSKFQE